MIINKTNDVRQELIAMTRGIAEQEEQNFRISECIARRMVIPSYSSSDNDIPIVCDIPVQKALPLIALARQMGIDDDGLVPFLQEMAPYLTVYSAEELMENPYFQRIQASYAVDEEGRFRIQNTEFLDGELFFDREPVPDGYARVNTLGIFEGNLSYPGFYEGGRCWMSITPNEIVTMQAPIENASGRVLTLGLGLGYFAYMAHLKEDVESVTIVERERTVIDLFEKYLLPQFDHPGKIRIICADAFDYMEHLADGAYNYCFADIWQNPLEGMDAYLRLKHFGNRFAQMECGYWIEESFVGRLELLMANVLQYEFLGEDDTPAFAQPGYREVKKLLSGKRIDTARDIRDLFGGEFMKELLRKL